MRSLVSLSIVLLLSATAAAQFKGPPSSRTNTRTNGATERKTAEKGTDRASKAAEAATAETELTNALLAAMDTDGDGMVSKVELGKAMTAIRKAQAHKDKQGNISYDKPGDTKASADAAPAADQAEPGAGPKGAGNARTNETVGRFMQYDRNHDGLLTPDELPPQAVAMLRDADLDHNGAIDGRELAAFVARMGEQARAISAGVGPGPKNGVPGDGGRKSQQ